VALGFSQSYRYFLCIKLTDLRPKAQFWLKIAEKVQKSQQKKGNFREYAQITQRLSHPQKTFLNMKYCMKWSKNCFLWPYLIFSGVAK
jgi:hypothetical protein